MGARLLPHSYQYPNLSEGTDRVSGQLRRDKEYPFSSVTKSGRVWRKVPESDTRSVNHPFTHLHTTRAYVVHFLISFFLLLLLLLFSSFDHTQYSVFEAVYSFRPAWGMEDEEQKSTM